MPVIHYAGPDASDVLIEVDAPPSSLESTDELESVKPRPDLEQALQTAKPAVTAFRRLVDSLPEKPDQVEFCFGLKASAEVGGFLVFAKAGAEATFGLKLIWKKQAGGE